MSKKNGGPVLIELDHEAEKISPATAPPVPEIGQPTGQALQIIVKVAARKPSVLARWFWSLLLALLVLGISVSAWDFVNAMIARNQYLGYVSIGLMGLFVAVLLALAMREFRGFSRLKRLDKLQSAAKSASDNLAAAQAVTTRILALYQSRGDTEWGRANFTEQRGDLVDADALLGLAEAQIIAPLDALARLEIVSAARQVATVTAIVPLALADVAVALTANLRMIRRIAEVYGGRPGALGNWRLTRSVFTHLVATGAVAVGDDLIGTIAGGGVMAKISRRFGEGVINGALTARVGVAAMEVCRPMPFVAVKKPSVTSLIKQALVGLFQGE